MKLNVNYFSKWLLVIMAMGLCNFAIAQRTITGTITDANTGEPLIGANILVAGTSSGTITDFDGNYTLNVPEGATELEISYTGYALQKVTIGDQTTLNIEMASGEMLDEVVVVGYGSLTQREITSAVTSIKEEDFNNGNVNNANNLIQGKVAGLSISNVGSDPNGNPEIRLRGVSSFGASPAPLVVIDGVIGATLSSVDPSDIASIDVLKDGSAAAIYGVRASAGVILITTKGGVAGEARINYRGYVTTESIADQPTTASPERFVEINGQDQNFGSSTDWVDLVTRNAFSQVHNLSISGGNGGTTYRASANYRDIEGIGITSGFTQLNARLNLTQKALNDRLTLSADVSTTDRDANFGFNEAFRYAVVYNPTAPATVTESTTGVPADLIAGSLNNFGGYFQAPNFDYFNPLAILELNQNVGELQTLLVSTRAEYQLFDGFNVAAAYSRQRNSNIFSEFYAREDYFRGGAAGGDDRKGRARQFTENMTNELFELTGTYDRDFGNIGFKGLVGYSFNEFRNRNFFVDGQGLPSNALGFNNLSTLNDIAGGQIMTGSFQDKYRVIGFFGRTIFSFGDNLNLTASLRYDGNSRNGPSDKWGLFPAVSASYDVGNALGSQSFDVLRVRAGYGVTGSLPSESYLSLRRFGVGSQFPIDGGYIPSIGPSSNTNPDLSYERKGELNVGLDFGLLDYRLTGNLEFYRRSVRDLLVNAGVPSPPFLFSNLLVNLNDVELLNSGIEFSIGYKVGNSENFSWEPRLNFSTFNTRLERVDGEVSDFNFGADGELVFATSTPGAPGQNNDPTVRVVVGEDLGQIFTRQLDLDASRESGVFTYVDQNGDGNIDDADKVVVGNGLPDFSLGFANNFSFGNIDFSFFLRGDFGHDLANMFRNFYEPLGSRANENNIQTEYFLDGVTVNPPTFSDYYVEDASYIILDNAQIGYTFDMGENSAFRSINVYLAGQNLFVITDYSGVDPTPRYADPGPTDNAGRINLNPNPLVIGIDRRNNYFRTRSFTLGVNVGF